MIKFLHMNGNDNPADIVTKSCASNTYYPLIKPLIFLRDMEFHKNRVVSEGSEKGHQHPLYLNLRALHRSTSSLILGIL